MYPVLQYYSVKHLASVIYTSLNVDMIFSIYLLALNLKIIEFMKKGNLARMKSGSFPSGKVREIEFCLDG